MIIPESYFIIAIDNKKLVPDQPILLWIIRAEIYQREVFMSAHNKRKTYYEKCPVCGGEDHPLVDETICFDELAPNTPVLAEVTPGNWLKVVERKPAKT